MSSNISSDTTGISLPTTKDRDIDSLLPLA